MSAANPKDLLFAIPKLEAAVLQWSPAWRSMLSRPESTCGSSSAHSDGFLRISNPMYERGTPTAASGGDTPFATPDASPSSRRITEEEGKFSPPMSVMRSYRHWASWPRIRWPGHGGDDGDGGRGSGGLAIESPSATNYPFLDFARSTKGKNRRTMGLGLMAPFFLLLLLVLGSGAVVQDKSVRGDYVLLDLHTREAQDSGPIYKTQITSSKIIAPAKRGSPLCSAYENVANKAVSYFREKQTQDDIMEILHGTCSQTFSLKQKCVEMVDSYATLLFAKISEIKPVEFCKQYGICKNMASLHVPGVKSESTCEICHHLVDEVLSKMKDPDARFEIIQLLIKECNKVQGHVQQCKRMVLEYIPLIMVNGEKFTVIW